MILPLAVPLALGNTYTLAQSSPPPGITIPGGAPETLEQTIPNPTDLSPPLPEETPLSPPQPNLQLPEIPQPPQVPSLSPERFRINQIEVLGSTVLQSEIAELTQAYHNQDVTFDTLLELRQQITQLYIQQGYVTSGAFLPKQDISDGMIQIQVVEGEIEQIQIQGLNHLKTGYVRRRLELATDTPFNQHRLEKALQLLQLDPLINQVNAELIAGSGSGRNILLLDLQEAPPFHAGISGANNQAPSIGSEQAHLLISHDNLFGLGDRVTAEYGFTEGLDSYRFNYGIPINARDGTISFSYSNSDSRILEAGFEELGINSESRTLSVNFRQPIARSPTTEFALGVSVDWRRSQTFLLDDIPFSFSQGPEDGESQVTVLRIFQEWSDRTPNRILAARSQFSLGLDAFDATINNTGTDGRFFSWLGQFQWVQRLSPRTVLLAEINTQLTPDALLSLERFGMGGGDSIRGYTQNQLVTDNGIWGSLEVRIPLTSNPNQLQLVPFFDIGTAWNNQDDDPHANTLASLGLGLNWRINSDLDLRLDYGIPLIKVNQRGDSLQESGFHFSLDYQPF
ncbi:outer membrane protein, OMP85 family, putative [Coleofasciculus chthonoplastes PCC 7420]|uniref:Outer membrane protein, OMP85 family, putative n=1 Tax=Coleofasciculus chthonoplastes PCC 7420 TaxID=118168 RepID=B4W381_9CYAN|nr:ShlB/FhaC/HecB family hemolysin secretion/activation protein [Coleofasciculus chthonoplastes]EDX71349.1 outer membrane protein, OMP85 family, putative [Coleofasciculus chthonoplastes PCC 7420]